MKTRVWMLMWGTIGMLAARSMGQGTVIPAIQGNGQLAWTNGVNTNALYHTEWASKAGGPWHAFTYQPMNTIDAHSGAHFSIEVPLFYRVVMVTNEPPRGMVWIDGGDVELGQTGIAEPVHTNFVSGFWMDAKEVTKAQWDAVAGWAKTNGYDLAEWNGAGKTNDHPVLGVSWYQAVKWCNARSKMEGLSPCYYRSSLFLPGSVYTNGQVDIANDWVLWVANGYRLPTEAEWEKAARGGRQGRLFPWGGDTIQHARANYCATNTCAYDTSPTQGYHPSYANDPSPYTSPVGSFPANGYGLYDIAGNVQEWCWDRWGNYSAGYQTDPHGPISGTYRIQRGGAWYFNASLARCANRQADDPASPMLPLGFRCVKRP